MANLAPKPKSVNKGKIQIKSIIAKKVIGYNKKDNLPFLILKSAVSHLNK